MKIKVFTGLLNDGPQTEGRMVTPLADWLKDNPNDRNHILRAEDLATVQGLDYYSRLYVAVNKDAIYSKMVYYQRKADTPAISLCPLVNLLATISQYPDAAAIDASLERHVKQWREAASEGKHSWPPLVAYWSLYGYTDKTIADMQEAGKVVKEARQRSSEEANRVQEERHAARDTSGGKIRDLGAVAKFFAGHMVSADEYEGLATDAGVWQKIPAGTRGSFRKNVSEISKDSYRIARGKKLSWVASSDVWAWCRQTLEDYLKGKPDLPEYLVVTYPLNYNPAIEKGTLTSAYIPGYRWRPAGYAHLELVGSATSRAFCGVAKLNRVQLPDGSFFPLLPPGDDLGVVGVVLSDGRKALAARNAVFTREVPSGEHPDKVSAAAAKFADKLAETLEDAGASAKVVAWVREHGVTTH